jgi:hypothetical protein
MARVGHILISGIVWVVIAGAIGWFGLSLADSGGMWSVLGWLIAFLAFGFAGISLMQLFRMVWLHWQSMHWMQKDPKASAEARHGYEAAIHQIEQDESTVEIIPNDDFMRRTLGGRPNQMDMSAYEGHPYICACGEWHTFYTDQVPVLRELPRMRLVFACPNGHAITCVRVSGIVRFKGFESLFGTRTVRDVE